MRRLLTVLFALLLLVPATCWGECACRMPTKPELPAGSADAVEMEKAGKDVDEFVKGMRQYRECLMGCLNRADNELSSVIEGWNYSVDRFNAPKDDREKSPAKR